jgi:hypothetical protein
MVFARRVTAATASRRPHRAVAPTLGVAGRFASGPTSPPHGILRGRPLPTGWVSRRGSDPVRVTKAPAVTEAPAEMAVRVAGRRFSRPRLWNRTSPDTPPPSALRLHAHDSRVVFHRLAHRVDRPGVLLDFPDRIATIHRSQRPAMIGLSAYSLIATVRALRPRTVPCRLQHGISDGRLHAHEDRSPFWCWPSSYVAGWMFWLR